MRIMSLQLNLWSTKLVTDLKRLANEEKNSTTYIWYENGPIYCEQQNLKK